MMPKRKSKVKKNYNWSQWRTTYVAGPKKKKKAGVTLTANIGQRYR